MYLPNLKTQTLNSKQPLSESNELDDLSNFASLSALTLQVVSDVAGYTVVKDYLTSSTTLEKVTFSLMGETGEVCSRALDELSAHSSFSSVGLKITVEPRFSEIAGDRPNLFVKSRVRYIENLDITNLRGNDQNVRYIEVIVND